MKLIYSVRRKEIFVNSFARDLIKIHVFGDIHRDTKACDEERFKDWLKYTKQTQDDNTYYICMGDVHDFASTSEKQKLEASVHETTRAKFDELAEYQNRKFAKEINHMQGKILCFVEGNHSWNFENGTSSDEDLAERMGSEFVGWLCHYTITFREKVSNKCINLYFALCHGRAGGRRAGSSINQVEDMKVIFPVAHVYCMGHNHQRGAVPDSVLIPNQLGEIKQLSQLLCRSGSFKKAYEPEANNYEPSRLFRPADLGALELQIRIRRNSKDGNDILIPDIKALV